MLKQVTWTEEDADILINSSRPDRSMHTMIRGDLTDADAMAGATLMALYGFSPLDRLLSADCQGVAYARSIAERYPEARDGRWRLPLRH